MQQTPAERRRFTLHPAIIKTLINEQAGSLSKAMAELVMNAVDAGATRITLNVDQSGTFHLTDDGRGFRSREEIEQFFETFGTPHDAGDAYYGRFRIGRGQIMSYARTTWRSGKYEMHVDLEGESGFFGYELTEHTEDAQGCAITGTFYRYDDYHLSHLKSELTGWDGDVPKVDQSAFADMIRFVPVPVLVNGVMANTLPSDKMWQHEDDYAHYQFDRQAREIKLYNRGVFVTEIDARKHGIGGVITTKQPLQVNMARNSVIEQKCQIWQGIREAISTRFSLQLGRVTKLTGNEATALLRDLIFTDKRLSYEGVQKVRELKFIPDVFDDLRAPKDMIICERFTLFDGKNMAIAERVQREGLATVVMPKLLRQAGAAVDEHNAQKTILRLRQRLSWSITYPCTFIPFAQFVSNLSDTSTFVPDSDLDTEEMVVIKALREISHDVARMTNGKGYSPRKIIAGVSDRMRAWTDGKSYIAIHRNQLKGIRGKVAGGSPNRLISLLIHEYAHSEVSLGEHHHDRDFLSRFHEAILHRDFGMMVDKLFRRYIAGIAKHGIVPSGEHRAYINGILKYEKKLSRKQTNNYGPNSISGSHVLAIDQSRSDDNEQ